MGLAQAAAALSEAQQEKNRLQASVENVQQLQRSMLSKELEALDAIDSATDFSPRLAFSLEPVLPSVLAQYQELSGGIPGSDLG